MQHLLVLESKINLKITVLGFLLRQMLPDLQSLTSQSIIVLTPLNVFIQSSQLLQTQLFYKLRTDDCGGPQKDLVRLVLDQHTTWIMNNSLAILSANNLVCISIADIMFTYFVYYPNIQFITSKCNISNRFWPSRFLQLPPSLQQH